MQLGVHSAPLESRVGVLPVPALDFGNMQLGYPVLDVDAGTDQLDTADSWQQWCACDQEPGDLERARNLRDQLWALPGGGGGVEPARLTVGVSFDSSGARLVGDSPLTIIAAAAATLTIEGCIHRVKVCTAPEGA